MAQEAIIIDFDDKAHRKMFGGWVKSLRGPHKVSIRKCRPNRTLSQNAWYWACVLPAVVGGLEECWGEKMELEDAHAWLKAKFNSATIVNRTTGEVVDHRPKSTASLDVAEFSEFIERVIKFAGESLQVTIPPPR